MTELLLYDLINRKDYQVFGKESRPEEEKVIGRYSKFAKRKDLPDIPIVYENNLLGKRTSKRHCIIEKYGSDYTVRDISRGGTYLNGQLVNDSSGNGDLLKNGDLLRLALHEFKVVILEEGMVRIIDDQK